jgi:hypothetical protein
LRRWDALRTLRQEYFFDLSKESTIGNPQKWIERMAERQIESELRWNPRNAIGMDQAPSTAKKDSCGIAGDLNSPRPMLGEYLLQMRLVTKCQYGSHHQEKW